MPGYYCGMGHNDIDLDIELVGIVNKCEVQHHKHLIEDAFCDFKRHIESGSIKDVMKQLVKELKIYHHEGVPSHGGGQCHCCVVSDP